MSDERMTPMAAAFQSQPKLEPLAVEQADAERASAFATHGDPSVGGKDAADAAATADGKVRVEWVYAADLGNRLTTKGMVVAADVHMRTHTWLREQGKRAFPLPGRRKDALPPDDKFGRTTPGREAAGRTPVG